MTENEALIISLEGKIKKLISLHENLKNENSTILRECEELRSVVKSKDDELKELQTKYEHLKLAKLLVSGGEDVHEAKLKVNRIVREIDKCIALLNK